MWRGGRGGGGGYYGRRDQRGPYPHNNHHKSGGPQRPKPNNNNKFPQPQTPPKPPPQEQNKPKPADTKPKPAEEKPKVDPPKTDVKSTASPTPTKPTPTTSKPASTPPVSKDSKKAPFPNAEKPEVRARSRSPIDRNKDNKKPGGATTATTTATKTTTSTSGNTAVKPEEKKPEPVIVEKVVEKVVEKPVVVEKIVEKVVEKIVERKYEGRPGEKKFNGRCRLFVANLTHPTSEEELKELFGEFGETGEVYVNKEKGFGFIRMDYRHNAEMAKLTLDKKLVKGRNISVRYATHASAIELHGLDNYASNEFITRAMSSFGAVERCVVVCDDRGRSKGYAIVEFEWKKSAAKVLDRLKDEMFCLGRLPKPVFAKPFITTDEEEGITEESLERLEGLEQERSHEPRFIPPNSFEYTWAKRWRDLFIEEQEKKAKLEQEVTDARCKLEFEMEAALRQSQASQICQELERRREELRLLEEDMLRRQEEDLRILERSRQREMAARSGQPLPDEPMDHINSRANADRQQDFLQLRQRAENVINSSSVFNNFPGGGGGGGPQMLGGPGGDMLGGGGGGFGGGPQQGGGFPGNDHGGGGWQQQQQHQQQQQGGFWNNQQQQQRRGGPPARDSPARGNQRDGPKNSSADKKVDTSASSGKPPVVEIDP